MSQGNDRYRLLIDNMPDAFGHHRIILDEQGNPVDYEYLDVNSAFVEMMGLDQDKVIGKRVTEVLPGIRDNDFDWIDIYGKVALTGESTRFQDYIQLLERWYDVSVYSEQTGFFVTIFRDISDLKQAEEDLIEQKNLLEGIIDGIPDVLALQHPDHTIERYNQAGYQLLNMTREEVQGKKCFELIGRSRACDQCATARALESKKIENQEIFIPELDIHLDCYSNPILDQDGNVIKIVEQLRDITEQKEQEKLLIESEERFQKMLSLVPDMISIQDSEMNIVYSNWNGFAAVPEEKRVLNTKCYKTYRDLEEICPDCKAKAVLITKESLQMETKLPGGRWVDLRVIPILDGNNNVELFVEWVKDITQCKKAEDQILYLAYHDKVTGLYNRTYLEEEIKRVDTKGQLPISIIMADLNGLKLINDTYGYFTGNELLKCTAEILENTCQKEDIIVRWGGDEFVILLSQTTIEKALDICKKIYDECKKTYVKGVPVPISLGAAQKNSKDKHLSEALKEAEDNMHKHKLTESRSGKSAVLKALLKTLEAKSFETEAHTRRMQNVALKIGNNIGLSHSELKRLEILIKLHDIGKINIPGEILIKKGALTAEEWELMKEHPETGYRIACSTEEFAHVAEDILAHHERWDGSGYPRGLKGKEIPLLARITSIADAYEVMTNGRPYKKALLQEDVVEELKKCAGTQFDPEMVEVFLSILREL